MTCSEIPLDEDTETVTLQVITGAGYNPGQPSTATVQIADNDPLPTLTINSVTVSEGSTAVFTVTLSPVSGRTVTANFATSNGTASGSSVFGACALGFDYVSQSGQLRFAPGTLTQTVSVPICRDLNQEGNETYFVTLTNVINATTTTNPLLGKGTIINGPFFVGVFQLTPTEGEVRVREELTYAFTWTVPEPENWHQLNTLDLRIRSGSQVALWVRFDEARNTLALFNEASGKFGPNVAPGSPQSLQTPLATLALANTSVIGTGPTGPSVTLNLSLSFKEPAKGKTFIVEVAAADDLGNSDAFIQTGTVTVNK